MRNRSVGWSLAVTIAPMSCVQSAVARGKPGGRNLSFIEKEMEELFRHYGMLLERNLPQKAVVGDAQVLAIGKPIYAT